MPRHDPSKQKKFLLADGRQQRISNRQKLFLLKRHHSGYLKRPEILETVYSVEEDSEQVEKAKNEDGCPSNGNSRRESSASSISLATIFRKRLDSDLTTGSDCSTDEESFTRIVLSETESCSLQSCTSRSTSGLCQCWQCAVSASAPASRRSSYGSNVISNTQMTDKTYFRVMTNHQKSVTKPKDVKFKRINKAKSRSLEELRGQLKCPPTRSSSTNDDEDIDDLEEDDEECSDNAITSRLGLLRKIMKQKSLSLEHESTD